MRVAFLGNAPWSVPTLRALAASDDVELVGVFTRPPLPAGRGSKLTPTQVADEAERLTLPLEEVDRVGAGPGWDRLAGSAPDLLIVVAHGELLSEQVLDLPRITPLNLHFSLLPRYRGAAPVQRALLDGREATGVTVMRIQQQLDAGPILAQRETAIAADDDAGSLGARLAELGAELMVEVAGAFARGNPPRERVQNEGEATMAPRVTEREIDWGQPAERIRGLVRALAPAPGAATTVRGRRLKVLRVEVTPHRGEPGVLVEDSAQGPVIGTGGGCLRLLEVAPEGRKRMTGPEFSRGARLAPREAFGGTS